MDNGTCANGAVTRARAQLSGAWRILGESKSCESPYQAVLLFAACLTGKIMQQQGAGAGQIATAVVCWHVCAGMDGGLARI
jgi:hypothetical protein